MTEDYGAVRAARSFAFDCFVLAPEQQLLLKDDMPVRIGGRALDLLTALVESAGDVVTKAQLMAKTWPDLVVEECNLKVNMASLRKALGDDAGAARYIATVPGRGYRFISPVRATRASGSTIASALTSTRAHNLPFGITRIFGREGAITTVARDLQSSRLVSIVGPGGIGKTTVALAVAESLIGYYRDGIWLVDLSPLVEATLVSTAIATVVGMVADSPNVLATLCEYMHDREMLILLDSCEHLIGHAVECANAILSSAPRVRILATSREQLRIAGERVRRLGGLDTPPATSTLEVREALTFPAIQLFVDRATDRLTTFELATTNAQPVAEICRRLDGHALAIELAASRLDTFGANALVDQLDEHFAATLAKRGGPARHQTLNATIDWSYMLLSEAERTVMQRLATFPGMFDLEAACAVVADDRVDRRAALAGLASLVDKSLIGAEIRASEVEYRLWDTTRSYALAKLSESGELDVVRRRHAEHALDLATCAAEESRRLPRDEWIAFHAHLIDDIRAATSWAFMHSDAAELGIRLTVAAIPLWKHLSLAEECRVASNHALGEQYALHRSARQELVLQQTLSATLLDTQGTLPEVKIALEAALAIATSLNDTKRQLECLRGLSEFELWTGDSHAVLAIAEKMRAITGEDADAASASADAGVGSALEWLGDLEGARHHLGKALTHNLSDFSKFGTARFEFNQHMLALASMTQVLWIQGLADQALAAGQRMLAEAEASQYAWSYCYARFQCAALALHMRDYDQAVVYLEEGEAHAAKHGITFWRGTVIAGARCRWKLYLGQPVDLAQMREVMADMRARGSRMYYPHIVTNYGEALARQHDLRMGLAAIDEAISLCETTGQILVIPEILRIKGNVIRWQDPDNWRNAAECYRRAIDLSRRDRAVAWEIRSATSLVKLTRGHGRDDEAEDMLARAYGQFSEGFNSGDLRRAKSLLDSRP